MQLLTKINIIITVILFSLKLNLLWYIVSFGKSDKSDLYMNIDSDNRLTRIIVYVARS